MPVNASLELGIADAVLGDFELGLGVIHRCLRRAQRLLGLIEIRACRPALLQQRVLALEMIGILLQPTLGRRKRGARGTKRVQFVLRIEFCHHLVRRDAITPISTERSTIRPPIRNASATSFSAWICPVSDKDWPSRPFRDDRADGARRRRRLSAVSGLQPASTKTSAGSRPAAAGEADASPEQECGMRAWHRSLSLAIQDDKLVRSERADRGAEHDDHDKGDNSADECATMKMSL